MKKKKTENKRHVIFLEDKGLLKEMLFKNIKRTDIKKIAPSLFFINNINPDKAEC